MNPSLHGERERGPRTLVPAVKRALALLERLAREREPMSLARLASDLELPKSSVHGLCSTLVSFGYLRRQSDGAFQIGPRVMGLAEAFIAGTNVAQEFNALWQATPAPEETIVLSVLDGAEVVYVGAPVFDAAGQAVAGVGVCVHKGRLGPDRGGRARSVVLDAAQGLSQRLGWQPSAGGAARAPKKRAQ
jgi:DNA-binding IclR family transcriptional regulator